jgi:hypothetical protein
LGRGDWDNKLMLVMIIQSLVVAPFHLIVSQFVEMRIGFLPCPQIIKLSNHGSSNSTMVILEALQGSRSVTCNMKFGTRREYCNYVGEGGGDTQFALVCRRASPVTIMELVWEDSGNEIVV